MKILPSTLLLVLAIWICSCRNDHAEDPQPAAITFSAPTEGAMFLKNETVTISGTIEAINDLHGYKITLRNQSTKAEVFVSEGHVHGKSVSFNAQWVNNLAADAVLEVEVAATLDHEGNTAKKVILIHCHS